MNNNFCSPQSCLEMLRCRQPCCSNSKSSIVKLDNFHCQRLLPAAFNLRHARTFPLEITWCRQISHHFIERLLNVAVQCIVSLPMKGTSSSGLQKREQRFQLGRCNLSYDLNEVTCKSYIGMIGQVDEFLQLAW